MAHAMRVDPQDFTAEQWREIFYCSELIPRNFGNLSGDSHEDAEAFEASIEDIADAAVLCRCKAQGLEDGTSTLCGGGDDVDEQEWADSLNEAAAVLEGYLVCICGAPQPCEHFDDNDPNPPSKTEARRLTIVGVSHPQTYADALLAIQCGLMQPTEGNLELLLSLVDAERESNATNRTMEAH